MKYFLIRIIEYTYQLNRKFAKSLYVILKQWPYSFFSDHYFTSVSWSKSGSVAVIWMNRAQNLSIVTDCAPPNFICREVRLKKSFFVCINTNIIFHSGSDKPFHICIYIISSVHYNLISIRLQILSSSQNMSLLEYKKDCILCSRIL